MCLFGWLIDVDGDLTLIDPTEPFLREEFGQDQREDSKENPRPTLKLVGALLRGGDCNFP